MEESPDGRLAYLNQTCPSDLLKQRRACCSALASQRHYHSEIRMIKYLLNTVIHLLTWKVPQELLKAPQ